MENRLVRLPEVLKRIGRASSSFYQDVGARLFPAPIKIRGRSFWRSEEVSAMVEAYTVGLTNLELRALSAALIKRRSHAAESLAYLASGANHEVPVCQSEGDPRERRKQ